MVQATTRTLTDAAIALRCFRFSAKLFYWLPRLHGIYKTHCLEIISRRVDHFTDVYAELKSKGFIDMLAHRCHHLS